MLESEKAQGTIGPYLKGKVDISHLAFADDLLLFMDSSPHTARNLKKVLSDFSIASGLHVNQAKSQVFVSPNDPNKAEFLSILGITPGSLPVWYLGLPMITSALKHAHCLPLLEKLQKRVQSWQSLLLSAAGRLELARSVLNGIHLYWTSAFSLPKRTIKMVKKIIRDFLWRDSPQKRMMHLMAWSSICLPKEEGGLSIKRITDWNSAALGVHFWDIAAKKDSLWVKWIHERAKVSTLISEGTWTKPRRWPWDMEDLWNTIKAMELGGHGSGCKKVLESTLKSHPLYQRSKLDPSPQGWLKANSDGSLSEDRAGYGLLLRNKEGHLIQAEEARVEGRSINYLELLAIGQGRSKHSSGPFSRASHPPWIYHYFTSSDARNRLFEVKKNHKRPSSADLEIVHSDEDNEDDKLRNHGVPIESARDSIEDERNVRNRLFEVKKNHKRPSSADLEIVHSDEDNEDDKLRNHGVPIESARDSIEDKRNWINRSPTRLNLSK
ncbi:hypothetical protein QJS10_CPB12g00806 [Acorus calamus]|uniref:Reverse transcriptase domain-containing protein n=1 Tax=Acorus calamus TaxID=4465 RepID=A0AAV9DQ03_ACOCL|nr:hypothetical protein QJS10_CPB12g00806 [Acorus calamus]